MNEAGVLANVLIVAACLGSAHRGFARPKNPREAQLVPVDPLSQ